MCAKCKGKYWGVCINFSVHPYVMAIRGSEDFGIIRDMERFFNIAGPCNPAKHYMLSATARLPEVMSLIRKEQYFVIHAQRQCGKISS